MKKITEITSEREFISKLRTYYRKARRKDYQRNEISFLGLMEYIGSATSEFEYQSEKYFSVGIRAYDWVHGNSLLSALIDKWENEIEAEKRKKQPATPTETPRISTETAETVNVSAEGEKAEETQEMQPERKITYFRHTPEQLKRYIIDVYQKNSNGEWVLQPHEQIDTDAGLWDVVDGKIGWWTNWRREKFSEMNMDFNSPTCGRCCKINRAYQTENHVVSNEKLLEFSMNGDYYYIQKQIYNDKEGRKEFYTIMDACGEFRVNDASDTLEGIMQRFDKCYKGTATIIWQAPTELPQSPETTFHNREEVLAHLDKLHGLEYDADEVVYFMDGCTAEEHEDGAIWYVYPDAESDEVIQTLRIAPQSPETPQTVECTIDTPKPRETARKPQNRGVGSTQHSGLGTNGYAMLDNASATLTAMCVPRECSTADTAYW